LAEEETKKGRIRFGRTHPIPQPAKDDGKPTQADLDVRRFYHDLRMLGVEKQREERAQEVQEETFQEVAIDRIDAINPLAGIVIRAADGMFPDFVAKILRDPRVLGYLLRSTVGPPGV
jgi:hypothetical protein